MLILEPGGTKSSFASRSAADVAPRHPAYADPMLPVNVMLEMLTDPGFNGGRVEAERVAEYLFEVLMRRRFCWVCRLGGTASAAFKGKAMANMEELERWREVFEGDGGSSWLRAGKRILIRV